MHKCEKKYLIFIKKKDIIKKKKIIKYKKKKKFYFGDTKLWH